MIAPVNPDDRNAVRAQTKLKLGWHQEAVWDPSMSALAVRVAGIFLHSFDGAKGQVSLANHTIAQIVGRTGRQVQTATKELNARNYTRVKYNRRGYATYQLVVDEPRGVDGALLSLDQERQLASGLGEQDGKPVSGLGDQDRQKTSGGDEEDTAIGENGRKTGSFSHQDRKFFASRSEADFRYYTFSDSFSDPFFPPHDPPQAAPERSGGGLAGVEHASAAGGRFQTAEAAIEAVIQVGQLSVDDAAMLRAFRFDPAAQRLIARTETALIAIRTRAGPALEQLGLQTACGAIG